MVCSVQTVLLSCTDTNTVSKWTKTTFHTTHVTYEFHQVCLKLFMTYGTFSANRAPIMCGTLQMDRTELHQTLVTEKYLECV
jgi:hypothetical protein